MARVFMAKAIRVRRAHRSFPTEQEYPNWDTWEPGSLVAGVTTVPVAWFCTAGHSLGATWRGFPVETTVDPVWTHWDRDLIVPDWDDDDADEAHTDVEDSGGDTAAFFCAVPSLNSNPTGTLDLGDPTDRASMRSTILTNGQVDTMRTLTGKNVPYGSSQMDVAKFSVREVGWKTFVAGVPIEVDQ